MTTDPDGRRHTPPPVRGDHFVQSLERGLVILRAFSRERPAMTLSEVARSTGLSRAAARRFLLTLCDLGYVRTDDRMFTLTPRSLDLGFAYLSSAGLPEIAQEHLERLGAELGESTSLSVLDGGEVVYVVRVPAGRIVATPISIGTRLPAYVTAMGRVLLAGLPDSALNAYLQHLDPQPLTEHTVRSPGALRTEVLRVREQGWALVDRELADGLRAVAVPVRGRGGRVLAAANVSAHADRTPLERIRTELLGPLTAAAAGIEADLARP
ncbi:IclR family transcriptional regulator [Murinocardiopsis flavida]|uniref:Glycerol operon regulatory protein n=1 Tax=Murinocardiopsis flavida TaxID=645275 RepID=A0A2P8D2D7_9ACTN|nr:IclR family transcriptional regulator C-terminal domain-containing protein [Murinocardiopsis flavida]PSK91382.1 IclR family transcriptional regulator [Murinocardiopsis flavida]